MTSEFCKVFLSLAAWGSLPHYCLPCLILPYVVLIIKHWGNRKKDRSRWFFFFFQATTGLCTDSVTILHISAPHGRGWTLVLPWDKQDYQTHKLHGRPGSCLVQASLFPQATPFWRKPLIFGRQTWLGTQSIHQWQTNIKQWQTASSGFGEGLLGWRSTDSAFIQTNF